MEKNGDDLELQTLLNGKEQKSHNEGWKQKNSSAVNGEDVQYFCWRKAAICISCASIVFTTAFGGTYFGESLLVENSHFP